MGQKEEKSDCRAWRKSCVNSGLLREIRLVSYNDSGDSLDWWFTSAISTSGMVHISYAYCHRSQGHLDTPSEVFHTRQLSYPVLVTVYHMLECHGLDILPYTADMLRSVNGDECLEASLQVQNSEDWCIFSVEVRNTYGIPFEVTFAADNHSKSRKRCCQTV